MSDLLWPGAERAGGLMSDQAVLTAMVRVEVVWLAALEAYDVAPAGAAGALEGLGLHLDGAFDAEIEQVSRGAEAGGNPVIPLVALLRSRLSEPAAGWVHRGLTSQDVLDTGLVLAAREAAEVLESHLTRLAAACGALAERHRADVMAGRTLTQHAVPTTFGLVAAGWLVGVLDALEDLRALTYPVQIGGAAGTRAALVELAGGRGADALVARTAADLDLIAASPWHTVRTPLTRLGDAVVRASDACGHLAADVLILARTEVGEVSEGASGGSSTMPGKANPVLATLVRRAALTTPTLAAQLHLAAADSQEQRTAGSWHTEGAVLRDLLRRAVVAASQAADLAEGLQVHTEVMSERAAAAHDVLRAEQRSMASLSGADPREDYLGRADALVATALDRARTSLKENQ